MDPRRISTASRRRQANLAGAGNIIAWNAGDSSPLQDASERATDEDDIFTDTGITRSPLASALDDEGGKASDTDNGHVVPMHFPARENSEPVHREIASERKLAPIDSDDAPPKHPRVLAAMEHASEFARQQADDLAAEASYLSATSRAEIEKDHALFLRVLIHRIQESRSVHQLWQNPPAVVEDEALATGEDAEAAIGAGWKESGVSLIPTAGYFIQALRYLQTAAHESVAVDILHAMSACTGKASLPAVNVDVASGEIRPDLGSSTIYVQVVGGLPTWSYPTFPSVDWMEYLCPVLETLLYTCYEDYLTVALRVAGHMIEAVDGLFDIASKYCIEADLNETEAPSEIAIADSFDVQEQRDAIGGACLRSASRQCVKAMHLMQPLIPAMADAAQFGGRVAKLTQTRLTRLQEMQSGVNGLVRAWHMWGGVPPAISPPSSRPPSSSSKDEL
jgi:hypothetical protein